jgi:glycine cleavage system H protein
MSKIPEDLFYTKEHEWIRVDGETAAIGITDHAQEALGDITFVELPEEGASFGAGDTFGVVESVKAASDIYLPTTGTVAEVNSELEDAPETLNSDPYGEGWLIKVRLEGELDRSSLLDAKAYAEFCENE